MNLAAATETANQPNWVALTLLSTGIATLATSQAEVSVSESLLKSWQGEFIVVWRMPPGYLLPTSEGSSGATVDWLGAQLSIYDGLPALSPAATFDKSFSERVQSFQKSVNLAPTGIVGPHTWVHLNSIEGIGVPFLVRKRELTPGSDD